jgi:hypothetical protein
MIQRFEYLLAVLKKAIIVHDGTPNLVEVFSGVPNIGCS